MKSLSAELMMDVPKVQRCARCNQPTPASRVFRTKSGSRVCEACYISGE